MTRAQIEQRIKELEEETARLPRKTHGSRHDRMEETEWGGKRGELFGLREALARLGHE